MCIQQYTVKLIFNFVINYYHVSPHILIFIYILAELIRKSQGDCIILWCLKEAEIVDYTKDYAVGHEPADLDIQSVLCNLYGSG